MQQSFLLPVLPFAASPRLPQRGQQLPRRAHRPQPCRRARSQAWKNSAPAPARAQEVVVTAGLLSAKEPRRRRRSDGTTSGASPRSRPSSATPRPPTTSSSPGTRSSPRRCRPQRRMRRSRRDAERAGGGGGGRGGGGGNPGPLSGSNFAKMMGMQQGINQLKSHIETLTAGGAPEEVVPAFQLDRSRLHVPRGAAEEQECRRGRRRRPAVFVGFCRRLCRPVAASSDPHATGVTSTDPGILIAASVARLLR